MNKDHQQRLKNGVQRQTRRLRRADDERHQWLAQTVFLGSLGLVFVLPVIAGAYLGLWLDGRLEGYSMSWTLSLIFVGIVVGAVNVYLMIRE
ncbi:MAG: AtpZ/AtpI family protein [Pseudomonadota bacterium]|nr:AtpZ/AtpI family protein [Pseudomonadota bacterium]